jgi:hypothetical protein
MSVKLIFSFDSEDYETPAADDAEKWWAEAMSRHGIRACTCVVGELARALRSRGRRDVIAAMAEHEVAFHSNMHSAHPTWAEYLDECGWDDGVERVMREESKGIRDVREVFGQHPSAWCKPGSSWGPQVAYAMTLMDVPVFCDSPFEAAPGQPLWYDNSLFLCYHTSFDRYFNVPHEERLPRMKEDFLGLCERHDGGYLVMYTHPCRLFTAQFTDTFRYGNNPPREMWSPAPLRPEREIAELQADFDAFLGFVVEGPNVELTTYREIYSEYRQSAEIWLGREDLRNLCDAMGERLDYLSLNGDYISPSEGFGAVIWALAWLDEHGELPEAVPVRHLLGPKEAPPEDIGRGEISISGLLEVCRSVNFECTQVGAVPARISLGGLTIGPNAFLQAGLRALREILREGDRPETVPIRPAPEYPAIVERKDFREHRFKGWTIFPPDFEGENVLRMIRLQAWTAKPATARGGGGR